MPRRAFGAEELSILERIHAEPRDDKIRLDYADWLAANGDPDHAELIRLQCRVPYVPVTIGSHGPPVRNELVPIDGVDFAECMRSAARMKEILRRRYRELFFPVPTGAKSKGEFMRGLPEYEADTRSDNPAAVADKLLARVSPQGRFYLGVTTDWIVDCLRHPIIRLVDKMDIYRSTDHGKATLGSRELRAVVDSGVLSRLFGLSIYGNMDTDAEGIFLHEVKGRLMTWWTGNYP